MENRDFKELVYKELSGIGKAISDPRRLELLDLLCQGAKNVETVAKQAGMSIASASHHLQILKESRLADVSREGRYAYYEATVEGIGLWNCLNDAGEKVSSDIRLAAAEFFSGQECLQALELQELERRISEENADLILIDVRPTAEYEAGHFPGAISVPLRDLESQLQQFSKSKPIIAYCRGRYCVMSRDAVNLLQKHGFQASRLKEGVVEFKARGWELATAKN